MKYKECVWSIQCRVKQTETQLGTNMFYKTWCNLGLSVFSRGLFHKSLLSWTKPLIFVSQAQEGTSYNIYHLVSIETKWQITYTYLNHKATWWDSTAKHHTFVTPHRTEYNVTEVKFPMDILCVCIRMHSFLGDTIWRVDQR